MVTIHWTLLIFNFKDSIVHHLDPFEKPINEHTSKLVKYIQQVLGVTFPMIPIKHCRQNDSMNCGVFVCNFMEKYVNGRDLFQSFDCNEYRRYIFQNIAHSWIQNKTIYSDICRVCLMRTSSADVTKCIRCKSKYHHNCVASDCYGDIFICT